MKIHKQVVRVGNSQGIVIDKIIRKQLNIKKGDYVAANLHKIKRLELDTVKKHKIRL